MRRTAWATLFLCFFCSFCSADVTAEDQPEREMLRLMELLEKWDMIHDLDMMRLLNALERMEQGSLEGDERKQPERDSGDKQK